MGWTIPQIKKTTAEAAAGYEITIEEAERVLSSMVQADPDGLTDLCNTGNWGPFIKEAERIGVVLSFRSTKRKTPRKRGDQTAAGIRAVKEEAKRAAEKVQADPAPLDFSAGLPLCVVDRVEDALQDFCTRYGVTDLAKDRQTRWKAACMYIGQTVFKSSDIIHDKERERTHGGTVYDAEKVAALVDLWAFLCTVYNKAPFADDFMYFAGITEAWLYGKREGREVTPALTVITKRLAELQEAGLAGLIADGRQNPTGALAILNHWHGWTQTREVIHTDGGKASGPAQYLTFGGADLPQITQNGEI